MADKTGSNMHNDAYMSDTTEAGGPVGLDPIIRSRTRGFGGYGTLTFNSQGQIVAVYSNGRNFRLEMLDPDTLQAFIHYDLPPRSWSGLLQGLLPWEYIGAGTYFYLDQQNRAIVPTTQNRLLVIQAPEDPITTGFELIREYDLSQDVVQMRWPKQDSVAWVLPDWGGEYYWFATTQGIIGTIQMQTGRIQTYLLDQEPIENSFAIGEEGIFVISDSAIYRFSQNGDGEILMDWRAPYDRGSRKKPGVITRGSGSSVTLVGGTDGYVVVTDNAEPQIHLLFLRRTDGQIACQEPLFQEGKSASDITAIGFNWTNQEDAVVYSAIVENNWGHHFFPIARPEEGIARVDLTVSQGKAPSCQTIWTSRERNIGVFKMSLGSGLIYLYYRDESLPENWYLSGLDFNTGQTAFRVLTGRGIGYNNWAGALFIHPDGKKIYSTTIFGLVMIQDTKP